jgi:hypothetical protein
VRDKEFEQRLGIGSLVRVKLTKMIIVFAVLGLWLGAANHCRLENVPALKFLACNPQAKTAPHQDNGCEQDSCATVEKAAFKTLKANVAARSPMLLLPATFVGTVRTEAQLDTSFEGFPALPPELPVTWQFSFRTAAPPRAPSFAS